MASGMQVDHGGQQGGDCVVLCRVMVPDGGCRGVINVLLLLLARSWMNLGITEVHASVFKSTLHNVVDATMVIQFTAKQHGEGAYN